MATKNTTWARAFSVGYYYGRSGRESMAELDLPYKNMSGFTEGFNSGVFDFQEIDLIEQAVSQ